MIRSLSSTMADTYSLVDLETEHDEATTWDSAPPQATGQTETPEGTEQKEENWTYDRTDFMIHINPTEWPKLVVLKVLQRDVLRLSHKPGGEWSPTKGFWFFEIIIKTGRERDKEKKMGQRI